MVESTAFIGLGIMGGSMASNLVRGGFPVKGFNRTADRPSARAAADCGVKLYASAAEAVRDADFVFLCLSDVPDIESMLFGTQGIADCIKTGALVVDMSTTGPGCARNLQARLSEINVRFLDAPVTGGDVGARNGTLTIMVGGAQSDFDACLSRFEKMGKNIRHCGPVGSGQALKLCNQVLCAVNLMAVCESFELARILNIDPQLIVDVCQSGAGGSWSLANLGPKILKSDFAPGFKIRDMLKDLRLVGKAVGGPVGASNWFTLLQQRLPATSLAGEKLLLPSGIEDSGVGNQGTQAMILSYRAKKDEDRRAYPEQ